MSDSDGYADEMGRFSDMSDRDIERLFAGKAPEDDAELGEVARFFADLDEAYPEASTESCEAAHVAAMIATAQLLAENGDPVARPVSKAHGPEVQASGLPKWRRNVMVRGLFASRLVRVGVIAAVLALVFGGVALAGALPGPVQDGVAGAAQQVGFDLPSSDDDGVDDADVDDVDDATVDDVDDATVDDVDDASVDQNDDAQVEQDDDAQGDQDDQGATVDEDDDDQGGQDDQGATVDDDDQGDQDDQGATVDDDESDDQADEAADETEEAADQD